MTINKPEVVAIKDSDVGGLVELKPVLRLPHGTRLIRLSDYERLHTECEKLVEALERISKRASEAECRQVPCSPIQRLFVDIMQQADDALAAYRKQGGEV